MIVIIIFNVSKANLAEKTSPHLMSHNLHMSATVTKQHSGYMQEQTEGGGHESRIGDCDRQEIIPGLSPGIPELGIAVARKSIPGLSPSTSELGVAVAIHCCAIPF